MAQTLTVKPQYVNTAQVFLNGKSILLNNNLTQEQLLAIWQKAEFRPFIDITYTNVADSFPENFEIDPTLFHAYDSGEVTHDPAKTNYLPNTLGKHLNETREKIDAFDGAFSRAYTPPIFQMNFASAKFLDPRIPFTRSGIGSYYDAKGILRYAPSNKPRFTHDPLTGESIGLICEESRTNILSYSSDFTRGATNIRGTVVTTAMLNPEGSSAQKFIEDTTIGTRQLGKGVVAIAQGITYTASIFLKAAERSFCTIQIAGSTAFGGTNPSVTVDLGLGLLSNHINVEYPPIIENVGNGWFRVQLTKTTVSAASIGININLLGANGASSYTGDGNSGIYIFGAQIEEGQIATSYIPTTDSAMTRGTDNGLISGNLFKELLGNLSIYGGTMYMSAKKISRKYSTNFNRYAKLYLDSDNEIAFGDSSITQVRSVVKIAGANYAEMLATVAENSFFNATISFSTAVAKGFVNGAKHSESGALPSLPSHNIFQFGGGINTIIKSIAIWNRPLDDTINLLNTSKQAVTGRGFSQIPGNSDLGPCAFLRPETLLRSKSRQEFSVDGTGASLTRNIRRDYDFTFEIVDSSGVTVTAQPASSCTAGTDNALTFTAPLGKTLTYAITPVYEN